LNPLSILPSRSEQKRLNALGRIYTNPYDFGAWNNWCLLLGAIDGRSFLRSVLLPLPSEQPRGKGLTWDTVYRCGVKWNDDRYGRKIDAAAYQAKIA
jgi:hypothetical protein